MGRRDGLWIDFNPTSEFDMARKFGRRLTVCRLLKEIYRDTDNEEIKMKCRVAVSMTRSFVEKIDKYRNDPDGHWRRIQHPHWDEKWPELVDKCKGIDKGEM